MPSARPGSAGRPPSGKVVTGNGKANGMSYEDLIIAQYLEELRKTKKIDQVMSKERVQSSPYSQRLYHTDIIPTPVNSTGRKMRPYSAQPAPKSRPQSSLGGSGQIVTTSKRKIDAKFIADYSLWEPATPKGEGGAPRPARKGGRPISAPVYKSRPWSGLRPSSAARRNKAMYRQQPGVIVATVFKNGSRDAFARVAAPNIRLLLESATTKLGLPSAARRVFLDDGLEVFRSADIPREAEIYISSGENYKDPYASQKKRVEMTHSAAWTMNGVVLPPQRTTKPRLSKRVKELAETKTKRICVFANGQGTESVDIVTELNSVEAFLEKCTHKLTGQAKRVFDWSGTEVKDIKQIPVIDQCLQAYSTPVLGPVWVSRGEGFNPGGAELFLNGLIAHTKEKLKEARTYNQQLTLAREGETESVQITAIKSMTRAEIIEALEMVEKDLKDYRAALAKLKDVLESLSGKIMEARDQGTSFTMSHIKEVPFREDHGLKLEVYENGSNDHYWAVYIDWDDLWKGLRKMQKGDKEQANRVLRERFMAACSRGFPDGRTVSRLFDRRGFEVHDVTKLETDTKLWASSGEAWKSPFCFVIGMSCEKAVGLQVEGTTHVYRDQLGEDDVRKDMLSHKKWEASIGYPVTADIQDMGDMAPESKARAASLLDMNAIDPHYHYLQSRESPQLILFPEVTMDMKRKRGGEGLLFGDEQMWLIHQDGHIVNKALPWICLAVSEHRLEISLSDDVEIDGYAVCVQKRAVGSPDQTWNFSKDGYMYTTRWPDLVLTYMGKNRALIADEEDEDSGGFINRASGFPIGHSYFAAVSPRLTKQKHLQRWAVKQERMDILGQWKKCDVPNKEWHKRALSWPVKKDGEWNEELEWPMEGFLLTGAPSMKPPAKQQTPNAMEAKRLFVMKNGERDKKFGTFVVGPDLTNMMKDLERKRRTKRGRSKSRDRGEGHKDSDSVTEHEKMHCDSLTIRDLEFRMFMENCTSMLNMPFFSRRVFDETGKEHYNLTDLPRDSLVYISCGDIWLDPNLTKAEQQRRRIVNGLGTDVAQMQQYIALRHPEDLVLAVEDSLVAGARIIVCEDALVLDDEVEGTKKAQEEQPREGEAEDGGSEEEEDRDLTYHEKSHKRAEERAEGLKWPWEKLVNRSLDDEGEEGAKQFSDAELYRKYRPKKTASADHPGYELQQFRLEDGFIACVASPGLVLGVENMEGRNVPLTLVKKRHEDPFQRWIVNENGVIQPKHSKTQVMGVLMPPSARRFGEPAVHTFDGCQVVLQQMRSAQFGAANQKWSVSEDTRQIMAFQSSVLDREITAANKTNVCTGAITQELIDQPGYRVEVTARGQHKSQTIIVCSSCARAMRGRHTVEQLDDNTDFMCPMMQAKELGLKPSGCFNCLEGKVDLSTHEAAHTVELWEDTYYSMQSSTSVREVTNTIKSVPAPRTLKVMCYKNGMGRLKKPEIIYASSVNGLLTQATYRLGLTAAARRLYTEEGALTLELDDIVSAMIDAVRRDLEQATRTGSRRSSIAGSDAGSKKDDEKEGEKPQEKGDKKDVKKPDQKQEKKEDEDEKKAAADFAATGEGPLRASSGKGSRRGVKPKVDKPPLDEILRLPIELWVSTGEKFITPEDVEMRYLNDIANREERASVARELEKEKHVLRQMRGRRQDAMSPGKFVATNNPSRPVVVEGRWEEPTAEEHLKHDTVHRLQSHLEEVRAKQGDGGGVTLEKLRATARLYQTPPTKRVLVYPNGVTPERAVYVWGESLAQVLDNASKRLHMHPKAKKLFNMNGEHLSKFDDIQKDQLLCVSSGKAFISMKASKQEVEVRANWGRARKQYGRQATDLVVMPHHNPKVDVDPFGPPILADPDRMNSKPPLPPS